MQPDGPGAAAGAVHVPQEALAHSSRSNHALCTWGTHGMRSSKTACFSRTLSNDRATYAACLSGVKPCSVYVSAAMRCKVLFNAIACVRAVRVLHANAGHAVQKNASSDSAPGGCDALDQPNMPSRQLTARSADRKRELGPSTLQVVKLGNAPVSATPTARHGRATLQRVLG